MYNRQKEMSFFPIVRNLRTLNYQIFQSNFILNLSLLHLTVIIMCSCELQEKSLSCVRLNSAENMWRSSVWIYIVHSNENPEIHVCLYAKSPQLCPTACNPMDSSPPGSSVHGIIQARILEWVFLPSSREFSQPRDRIHVS